jgi:hypothetical protein
MKLLILFFLCLLFSILHIPSGHVRELRDSKPFCIQNEYVTGRWMYDNSTDMKKSFICCAYNHNEKFVDKKYCLPLDPKFNKTARTKTTTKFRYSPNQGSNKFFVYPEGDGCSCDLKDGSYSVHNRERYYWKPDKCDLPRWNAKDFCRLLSNRALLVLGDSTGMQSFGTLANMITSGQGDCADQIHYDWSTDLKMNGARNCYICGSHDIYNSVKNQTVSPDIVFILSGAHVHSIEDFQNIWKIVSSQLRKVHKLYPKIKFIYKSQNPDHTNCSRSGIPTETIAPVLEDKFHWNLHPEFDRISSENVKSLQSVSRSERQHHQQPHTNTSHFVPFIQYMDMTPLAYRPDGHTTRDCLHYCTPGPLDLFPILVYNKLLRSEL